jgi:hypothetical protein
MKHVARIKRDILSFMVASGIVNQDAYYSPCLHGIAHAVGSVVTYTEGAFALPERTEK